MIIYENTLPRVLDVDAPQDSDAVVRLVPFNGNGVPIWGAKKVDFDRMLVWEPEYDSETRRVLRDADGRAITRESDCTRWSFYWLLGSGTAINATAKRVLRLDVTLF